jgi:hypothetical protein
MRRRSAACTDAYGPDQAQRRGTRGWLDWAAIGQQRRSGECGDGGTGDRQRLKPALESRFCECARLDSEPATCRSGGTPRTNSRIRPESSREYWDSGPFGVLAVEARFGPTRTDSGGLCRGCHNAHPRPTLGGERRVRREPCGTDNDRRDSERRADQAQVSAGAVFSFRFTNENASDYLTVQGLVVTEGEKVFALSAKLAPGESVSTPTNAAATRYLDADVMRLGTEVSKAAVLHVTCIEGLSATTAADNCVAER